MQRQIDLEISQLKGMILAMGGAVESAVEEVTLALKDRNLSRISRVKDLETQINQFQIQIDERCLKLIASQSPLAADLRTILAVLKINSDLERMGDQTINISHNVREYLPEPPLPLINVVLEMAIAVRTMIKESLDAFIRGDVEVSKRVLLQDDAVDEGKNKVFTEATELMKQNPDYVDGGLDLILIARNLERLGDHATNIAEDVIFVSTGQDIRHGGFRE